MISRRNLLYLFLAGGFAVPQGLAHAEDGRDSSKDDGGAGGDDDSGDDDMTMAAMTMAAMTMAAMTMAAMTMAAKTIKTGPSTPSEIIMPLR